MKLLRHLSRAGNAIGISLYRLSSGRLPASSGDVIIGLLTVPGRRSGKARAVPLGFFPYRDGYLVVGTAGGARQDPQWFLNLREVQRARVQLGSRHIDVDVYIAQSTEREALWREVVLNQAPRRQRYAAKAGRPIPIAVLLPCRSPETG